VVVLLPSGRVFGSAKGSKLEQISGDLFDRLLGSEESYCVLREAIDENASKLRVWSRIDVRS
jgi:hypothetical protein